MKVSRRQMEELQRNLAEAEDTLNAIRSGTVDALVVHTPQGEQLFTLKGADQTYRALVEAMSEGAVTLKDGVVSYCNNHFAAMARAPLEKVFGSSIFDFVPSEDFRQMTGRLQKGRLTRASVEAVLHTRDGALVPVFLSGSRYFSDEKPAVGLVVTDISAQKEAERARRELSHNILKAQEAERQRVARDLHDGVNQLLSSVKYRLYTLATGAGGLAKNQVAKSVLELVDKAIAEVRLISRNLRPSELDDLGLAAALRTLTHEFQKRSGIAARLKTTRAAARARIHKDMEMTLYRIAQESLNNVEKHSGASRVELGYHATPTQAMLTIHDNGRGFERGTGQGLGLQNMSERAAMLRGRVAVWSLPEIGTKVTVRIPLSARPGKAGTERHG